MFKFFEPFVTLMESGGNVLWILFIVAMILFALLSERLYFYSKDFPEVVESEKKKLAAGDKSKNWRSFYELQADMSALKLKLSERVSLIEVLTFMCPLFGLLGTVTGMIAVFDVMAHKGLGNPRLMAGGVSQATLPTMVSMVIALVGLIGLNHLKNKRKAIELELNEVFKLES